MKSRYYWTPYLNPMRVEGWKCYFMLLPFKDRQFAFGAIRWEDVNLDTYEYFIPCKLNSEEEERANKQTEIWRNLYLRKHIAKFKGRCVKAKPRRQAKN